MKSKLATSRSAPVKESNEDKLCKKIMLKAGRYYQAPDIFYQRLWRERLEGMGFVAYHVERFESHPVWNIRLRGSLRAQAFLLLCRPAKKNILFAPHLLERQLKAEVQHIAKDLGSFIKSDCVHVSRAGKYFRIVFVWEAGKPGLLLRAPEKIHSFSFLIKPWLDQIRN